MVDGYSDESIEGLYNEYKERFAEEQYQVLFSELEEDRGDSEVSYKSKDGSTTGIVALARIVRQRERLRARDGATGGLS